MTKVLLFILIILSSLFYIKLFPVSWHLMFISFLKR